MPAYVISEVRVLNEQLADAYRKAAAASIARYGGRYLARGAHPDAVEGAWPDERRMVIVEFPSMEEARRWYESPEYADALAIRRDALDRRLLFVDSPALTDGVSLARWAGDSGHASGCAPAGRSSSVAEPRDCAEAEETISAASARAALISSVACSSARPSSCSIRLPSPA